MSSGNDSSVVRVLRVLAEHLEAYLDGDELALETLAEAFEQEPVTAEALHTAAIVLRDLANEQGYPSMAEWESAPGEHAHRILSPEERQAMSTEAWGYLIDLRRRGSLDPGQFEQVLDLLTGSGVRPIGVDLAREVATRVALQVDEGEGGTDIEHGEADLTH
jgi:uncharacterized protein Smg (DUF494 family)